MKSEKGITLISLIIYLIGLTVAIVMITVVSSYFYKNIDGNIGTIDSLVEYTKFNSYFTEQMNKENIEVVACELNETDNINYIVFNDGTQYTFIKENGGVYFGCIKIAGNVEVCKFEYTDGADQGEKKTVKVTMKFIDSENIKENLYTIN